MTDERRNDKSVHVQVWVIPILLTIFTSFVVGAMTWRSFEAGVARADEAEVKNSVTRTKVEIQEKEIISIIKVMNDTNSKLDKFIERYDDNREEDQKMFRDILLAVKK